MEQGNFQLALSIVCLLCFTNITKHYYFISYYYIIIIYILHCLLLRCPRLPLYQQKSGTAI